MLNYKEKDCNDHCGNCPHNILLEGRDYCDVKMIDLTGTKVKFTKDGFIMNRIEVIKDDSID